MESLVKCPGCNDFFGKKGLTAHRKSCKQKTADEEDQARYMARRRLRKEGEWASLACRRLANEIWCVPDPASALDAPALHEIGSNPALHEIGGDPTLCEIDGNPTLCEIDGDPALYEIGGNPAPYGLGTDPRVASSTMGVASQPQNSVSVPRLRYSWVLLM